MTCFPRRPRHLRPRAPLIAFVLVALIGFGARPSPGDEPPPGTAPAATPKKTRAPATLPKPKPKPGKTVLRFAKVSKSCYVAVQSGGRSNAGFVIGTEAVLVVDCLGSPALAKELLKEVRRHSDKPIKHVALTHWHYDHSVGNQAFPKNAAIYSAPASVVRLKERLRKDRMILGRGSGMHGSIDIANVRDDVVSVMREREIDLGGVKVKLADAGECHSPGDLVVFVPEEKVLFVGDLVWSGLHPNVSEGSTFRWIVSLARLSKLEPKVVVAGHGVPGDTKLLTDQRKYIMGLRRMVKHLAKRGVEPAEIVEQLKIPTSYEKFGNSSYWQKTVRFVVSEIANGR